MYYRLGRRRVRSFADAHDRQPSTSHRSGSREDFLRRHEDEATTASREGGEKLSQFRQSLLTRAGDFCNVALAIEHCATRGQSAELVTASQYVDDGLYEDLPRWLASGWPNSSSPGPRSNPRLWRRIVEAIRPHQVHCRWVPRTNGDSATVTVNRWAREYAELRRAAARTMAERSQTMTW